jgi:hypothetical protein
MFLSGIRDCRWPSHYLEMAKPKIVSVLSENVRNVAPGEANTPSLSPRNKLRVHFMALATSLIFVRARVEHFITLARSALGRNPS